MSSADGSGDDPSSDNVFVRFKKHIDSHVSSGINMVLGLPSPPSRPITTPDRQDSGATSRPFTAGSSCPRNTAPVSSSTVNMSGSSSVPSPSWDDILTGNSSEYSPEALLHLPQPVPSDLPPYLQLHSSSGSIFTFKDAFEDLLISSQDRPLPSITERHLMTKMIRGIFPYGEPNDVWLTRMYATGVLPPSLVPESFIRRGESAWDSLWRSVEQVDGEPKARPARVEWPRRESMEVSSSETMRRLKEDLRFLQDDLGEAYKAFQRSFSSRVEMIKPMADHERDVYKSTASSDGIWKPAMARQNDDTQRTERTEASSGPSGNQPDHFDDLFDAVESAFASTTGPLDIFKKVVFPTQPPTQDTFQPPPPTINNNRDDSTDAAPWAGGTQVTTKKEFVDDSGRLHSTVEVQTLDAGGNEVSRSTTTTTRMAAQAGVARAGSRGCQQDEVVPRRETGTDRRDDGADQPKGSGGWFW